MKLLDNDLINSSVSDIQEALISLRRHLHTYPELSYNEFKTTDYIFTVLKQNNLEPVKFSSTTGCYVDVKSGKCKLPLVLVRADIDALPIIEESKSEFCSMNPGVMHACGHDVHSAIVMGVAIALQKLKGRLDFNVRIVFQPAEEMGTGALDLIKQGVLEGVDYVISQHIDPNIKLGSVAIKSGPINAAVRDFNVILRGKSAHVGRVHQGVDVIGPACQFINNCYSHIPKKIDARDPYILYFGVINSGSASNIVSDKCEIKATIRAFKSEVALQVLSEVKKIADGTSTLSDVEFSFSEIVTLGAVNNDSLIAKYLFNGAEKVVGVSNIISDLPTSMGGEDFGAYMDKVPGAMVRIGVAPIYGESTGLHTATLDVPEECIPLGSKIMLNTLFEIFHELKKD